MTVARALVFAGRRPTTSAARVGDVTYTRHDSAVVHIIVRSDIISPVVRHAFDLIPVGGQFLFFAGQDSRCAKSITHGFGQEAGSAKSVNDGVGQDG